MLQPFTRAVTTLLLATCIGCAPFSSSGRTTRAKAPASTGNAFILDRTQLRDFEGVLLLAMVGRVPGFRVDRSTACPALTLRGSVNSVPGITDPLVYLDGTRTSDTCILEQLQAIDVERVEIYPMGVTTRPGYSTHPHGLILVFMREH